jgi:hypothetical protein
VRASKNVSIEKLIKKLQLKKKRKALDISKTSE